MIHSGLSPEGGAFALADEFYVYVIHERTALSAVPPYHCINLPKTHASLRSQHKLSKDSELIEYRKNTSSLTLLTLHLYLTYAST